MLGEVQQFGLRLPRDRRQLHAVLSELGLSLDCHVYVHLCALHLDRIVDSGQSSLLVAHLLQILL